MNLANQSAALESKIKAFLSDCLAVPGESIQRNVTFSEYGTTSIQLVALVRMLEKETGRELPPTLAWEFPTVAELTEKIVRKEQAQGTDRESLAAEAGELAIVGMSCRFPGAPDLESFWSLCWNGVDAIGEVPPDRWDVNAYYDPDPRAAGKTYARWGGFLKGLDAFDAAFFGISPREAIHVDPRQRLILETSWEALEDAEIAARDLAGSRTGVFIATLSDDYARKVFSDQRKIEAYSGTGTAHSIVANRVSYFYDFRGPSIALDTACSGSLVAMHLAGQSLRGRECDLALVGGVNVLLSPDSTLFFSRAGALARDGRCKAFDHRADGFVRSEGAGVVVVKRLADAIASRDRIYAVVCGSAMTHDGRTNGLMAPSGKAQEAVLRLAYENARIAPSNVQYVEAHGTGTQIGDPIEAAALGAVLGKERSSQRRCLIGSVKTNIGHTEAAAGIAGVIKTALAIHKKKLPGSLHFTQPNPLIPFDSLALQVAHGSGEWPDPSRRLVAGVSSFGFGGTNGHVVLAEAPRGEARNGDTAEQLRVQPLLFSAQSAGALQALAGRYAEMLRQDESRLAAMAEACANQRSALNHRLAVTASSVEGAIESLMDFAAGNETPGILTGTAPAAPARVAFVFSGQGTQWRAMGRCLMRWPAAAAVLEECDRLCGELAGFTLLDSLTREESALDQNRTDIAQLSIFMVQVAIAGLLRSWGITPQVVMGQSLGEVAAAYASGALSLRDAFCVVQQRGRLMLTVEGRGMTAQLGLARAAAEQAIQPWGGRIEIAGVSGPATTIVAGETAAIEEAVAQLSGNAVFAQVVRNVHVAFHSSQMDPLCDALEQSLANIAPGSAQVPYFSTVEGQYMNGKRLDARYWRNNLRQPFNVCDALAQLLAEGVNVVIEIGPHSVLRRCVEQLAQEGSKPCVAIPTLFRGDQDGRTLAEAAGKLFVAGLRPFFGAEQKRPKVPLPKYPWQRERYWIDAQQTAPERKRGHAHPLLGESLRLGASPWSYIWETDLAKDFPHYLADHKVFDRVVFPGSAYIEIALAAAQSIYSGSPVQIEDVVFHKALALPEEGYFRLQVVLTPEAGGRTSFAMYGAPKQDAATNTAEACLYASGYLRKLKSAPAPAPARSDLQAIAARCGQSLASGEHYARMESHGLSYGNRFRLLSTLAVGNGEALAKIVLPQTIQNEWQVYRLHPACLDALFQLVAPLAAATGGEASYLPAGVASIEVLCPPETALWAYARTAQPRGGEETLTACIELLNESGEVAVRVNGLALRRVGGSEAAQKPAKDPGSWLYEPYWEKLPSETLDAANLPRAIQSWICVGSGSSLRPALQAVWQERGNRVAWIDGGPAFQKNGRHFAVRATEPEDYRQVLNDLRAGGWQGTIGVVNLLPVSGEYSAGQLPQGLTVASLALLQGIAAHGSDCRLFVVTRGSQAVAGSPVTEEGTRQSAVWGMTRLAFESEHVALRGALLDLDVERGDPAQEAAVAVKVFDALREEDQAVVRGGELYTPRLRPASYKGRERLVLDPAGAYLVAGGLGAIGLKAAQWLAARGARRVILLSRTPLPPREQWTSLAATHPQKSAIEEILSMEARGCQIDTEALDVSDLHALQAYRRRRDAESRQAIRGIIHAAGVLRPAQLAQATLRDVEQIFAAKVAGSSNLWKVFGSASMDFFVLFSSLASLSPVGGQGIYASANAFLDAFAHHLRGQSASALSVNWGPWEAGMMASGNLIEYHASRGMFAMNSEACINLLDAMILSERAQCAVADADWLAVVKSYPQMPPILRDLYTAETPATLVPLEGDREQSLWKLLEATPQEAESMLLPQLREQVATVFRMPPERLDPDQPLTVLGLDSMMATEIKNRLEALLKVRISAVEILKGLSTIALTQYCIAQLTEELNVSAALLLENASEESLERALAAVEQITL
jgi:myxalamid-type polyketide synthase MxaE and MxaD